MTVNRKTSRQWLAVAGVSLVVILGAGAMVLNVRSCLPVQAQAVSKAFYSDDDGASTFVDDLARVTPFDHHGKPACLARVYKSQKGATFVAWLERYSERGRQLMAEVERRRSSGEAVDAQVAAILASETEVKRPGETQWALRGTPAGSEIITNLTSPDGSEVVEAVTP